MAYDLPMSHHDLPSLEGWKVKEDHASGPSEVEKKTKTWPQLAEENEARHMALVEFGFTRAGCL
jgi:hypothetical protein